MGLAAPDSCRRGAARPSLIARALACARPHPYAPPMTTYGAQLRRLRLATTPTAAELARRAERERQRPIAGISIAELAGRLAASLGRDESAVEGLRSQVSLVESDSQVPSWDRALELLALLECSAPILSVEATEAARALAARWRVTPDEAVERALVERIRREREAETRLGADVKKISRAKTRT